MLGRAPAAHTAAHTAAHCPYRAPCSACPYRPRWRGTSTAILYQTTTLLPHCCHTTATTLLRQARLEARAFGAVVLGSAARTLGPAALPPLVRARYERRLGLGPGLGSG